jgi:hypothetical protein
MEIIIPVFGQEHVSQNSHLLFLCDFIINGNEGGQRENRRQTNTQIVLAKLNASTQFKTQAHKPNHVGGGE